MVVGGADEHEVSDDGEGRPGAVARASTQGAPRSCRDTPYL
jgi:hypothetical protein